MDSRMTRAIPAALFAAAARASSWLDTSPSPADSALMPAPAGARRRPKNGNSRTPRGAAQVNALARRRRRNKLAHSARRVQRRRAA